MKYKPGWSTKNTGQIENKKHEEQTQWHQEEERELKWDKKRVGKTQRQETNTWQMRINIPKQNRKQPNRRPNPWHVCASEIKSFTDEKSALKACNFFIYIFANTAEYLFLKKKLYGCLSLAVLLPFGAGQVVNSGCITLHKVISFIVSSKICMYAVEIYLSVFLCSRQFWSDVGEARSMLDWTWSEALQFPSEWGKRFTNSQLNRNLVWEHVYV